MLRLLGIRAKLGYRTCVSMFAEYIIFSKSKDNVSCPHHILVLLFAKKLVIAFYGVVESCAKEVQILRLHGVTKRTLIFGLDHSVFY